MEEIVLKDSEREKKAFLIVLVIVLLTLLLMVALGTAYLMSENNKVSVNSLENALQKKENILCKHNNLSGLKVIDTYKEYDLYIVDTTTKEAYKKELCEILETKK